ncbi:MAG: tetratricopeptide repeat protein [Armatimonadota bacterium]
MLPLAWSSALAAKMVACALIAFAGCYWILANWFDQRLSGRETLLLMLGLLSLTSYAVSLLFSSGPGVAVIAAVVFGGAGALRVLAAWSDRRLADHLDEDEVAKYKQAVEDYPDNPYPHSLLADVYRRLGQREDAIAEYEAALALDPSLREERYWLGRIQTELDREAGKVMACPRCGALRRGKEAACAECGRPYSTVETWSHRFRRMEARGKAVWLGGALGALIVLGATAALAPRAMKAAAVVAAVLLPLAVMAISMRMRRSSG